MESFGGQIRIQQEPPHLPDEQLRIRVHRNMPLAGQNNHSTIGQGRINELNSPLENLGAVATKQQQCRQARLTAPRQCQCRRAADG